MGKRIRSFFSGKLTSEKVAVSSNLHESEIRKVLDQVAYSGNQPLKKRLVLLGFVNRSGSNLLGEYLSSLPGLYGFEEKLNHTTVTHTCTKRGIESFEDYLRHLCRDDARGSFGLKASGAQVEMLHKWRFLEMFESVKAIHIQREDIVSQAVSFWIARHTKQWTSRRSRHLEEADVQYDFDALSRIIGGIGRQNTRIAAAFSALNIRPWSISYERLLADPEGEMRAVAAFLGVDARNWRLPEKSAHRKQRSQIKAEYVTRLRADLAARW
jgi:trehalose 2-sulfotransferase